MSTNKKIEKRALTPSQVAEAYGLSEGSLANLRSQKKGARYYKVGRKVLYLIEDLEAWIKSSPCLTTDSVLENP